MTVAAILGYVRAGAEMFRVIATRAGLGADRMQELIGRHRVLLLLGYRLRLVSRPRVSRAQVLGMG